jgi:hypothetical protein
MEGGMHETSKIISVLQPSADDEVRFIPEEFVSFH